MKLVLLVLAAVIAAATTFALGLALRRPCPEPEDPLLIEWDWRGLERVDSV